MRELVESMLRKAFDDPALEGLPDAAALATSGRIAFTTDSYVVDPLRFPGGTIGGLAVNGTVNDLAMVGASPMFLSVALILEEGLELQTLWDVVVDMRRAADAAGVRIVTGDTKVVERGRGHGVFVTTTGIGSLGDGVDLGAHRIVPGDAVVLSGDIGRHGVAVMSQRDGLRFADPIESDCASLAAIVAAMQREGVETHCMRDLTRGGLAAALVELSDGAGVEVEIDEAVVPVEGSVRGACEILGLDPMHVANEGRFVAFVDPNDAERAVDLIRDFDAGRGAVVIGRVRASDRPRVLARSPLGTTRIVDMLSGSLLPRIC